MCGPQKTVGEGTGHLQHHSHSRGIVVGAPVGPVALLPQMVEVGDEQHPPLALAAEGSQDAGATYRRDRLPEPMLAGRFQPEVPHPGLDKSCREDPSRRTRCPPGTLGRAKELDIGLETFDPDCQSITPVIVHLVTSSPIRTYRSSLPGKRNGRTISRQPGVRCRRY
jgi:hypothetical protein